MKNILLTIAIVTSIGSANAAVTVVEQHTFNDNVLPAGYTVLGTPTVSGGQLQLDGSSGLSIATPLTATDNYGIEAIVTVSQFDAFDFIVSNSVGITNVGAGLLMQGSAQGIVMGVLSYGGSPLAVGTEVRMAVVRDNGISTLYVDGLATATTLASHAAPTQLNIGYNPFDGTNGRFNGSINEVRLFTFTAGQFATTDLLTEATPVPEPSSTALLGLGGLALILRRRK